MRHLLFAIPFFLFACGTTNRIQRYAQQQVLNDSALLTAHVGISVYEPATGRYLYNYQGDKYFVPASNTKLPTCYAAMKYLGDSLVGLRFNESTSTVTITGTGDPTFLHEGFANQPVYSFLKERNTKTIIVTEIGFRAKALGNGWSWNDFQSDYMPERSSLPIYGNLAWFSYNKQLQVIPSRLIESTSFDKRGLNTGISVSRATGLNTFFVSNGASNKVQIPFSTTDGGFWLTAFLRDTLHSDKITMATVVEGAPTLPYKPFHSQPTDSLLRPMMHRSDNFFAEQSLLMVSNEHLGYMSDAAIIDTLLKTDLKDLPQKPHWADGSGLSRYNLFTPQDFVFILNKMKNEFGMARIKDILPTGGEGTLGSYYVSDSSFIYAKTGTLSGVVALSGFLYTEKGKELIFSILVNNHQSSATAVRRAVERYIKQLRKEL